MLRPVFAHRINSVDKEFVRNKVIKAASILKPADKIKQFNKENKELFGPLLETSKEKKKRAQESAKNRLHQNNAKDVPNETTLKCIALANNIVKSGHFLGSELNNSAITCIKVLKNKMWQNTRTCFNFVGVLCNGVPMRSLKTNAYAAQSSAAQPGYVSEDKILQIKKHQNDFTQQYPSVTLILNRTMSEESRKALEKWKQEKIAEMGLDEFNKYHKAQLAAGTKFHSTIKDYFTQPQTHLRIEKDVEGVWISVADVLKNVSSPKAIESNVCHPVLKYRGIFDAIADYEEKPTLIEWKKSDKPRKSIAMTYDNPVQLAAYFGAVCNDLNYKHMNVRDALLVIAYTDGSKADVFHLSTDKLREHWAQWLIRLEEYTMKFGHDAEKKLKGGKRLFEEQLGIL